MIRTTFKRIADWMEWFDTKAGPAMFAMAAICALSLPVLVVIGVIRKAGG